MNPEELKILIQLRKNARQTLSEISKKTNIPTTTVFDKIEKINKKYVKSYKSFINFEKAEFPISIFFAISAETNKKTKLKNFLAKNKNMNTLYKTNEGTDFLVHLVFKNMLDYYMFKQKLFLFGIKKEEVYYIIEDLKIEGFLNKEEDIINLVLKQN